MPYQAIKKKIERWLRDGYPFALHSLTAMLVLSTRRAIRSTQNPFNMEKATFKMCYALYAYVSNKIFSLWEGNVISATQMAHIFMHSSQVASD